MLKIVKTDYILKCNGLGGVSHVATVPLKSEFDDYVYLTATTVQEP